MMLNQNEKYLLRFISSADEKNKKDDLLDVIINFGIKMKFSDFNPVYQIIDELNFSYYKSELIGK